jgi:hypothetical protein
MEQYRDIHIRVVSNGFIVEVGCQSVVFQNYQEMLGRMDAYFKDPEVEELKLYENHLSLNHARPNSTRTETEQVYEERPINPTVPAETGRM